MAIAFDNNAQQTTNNSTLSYTMGSVTNGILFVAIVGDISGDNLSGVTYNGVAMSLVNKIQYPSDRWQYLYYLVNPASGTHNVVASGLTFCNLAASSYSGAAQTGVPDSQTTVSATASAATLSTTVIASNCWIIAHEYGGGSHTAGTGTTARGNVDANPVIVDSNGTVSTGSQSLTVNFSGSSQYVGITASFAPYVASATKRLALLGVG